jgi:hypothetical protein
MFHWRSAVLRIKITIRVVASVPLGDEAVVATGAGYGVVVVDVALPLLTARPTGGPAADASCFVAVVAGVDVDAMAEVERIGVRVGGHRYPRLRGLRKYRI